ncbi:hypothetical protein AFK68_13875 [Hydrocoleum sp. CS-953]|nr:hypothetical protein AFK68_13875 [Hydrocoleum sp. CS-953]
MERWRDGEMGRWDVLDISHSSNHQINSYPFFINYFSLQPIFWRYQMASIRLLALLPLLQFVNIPALIAISFVSFVFLFRAW